MTQKPLSLLTLTDRLARLKAHKQDLHTQLIETNRQIKAGKADKPMSDAVKEEISLVQSEIRSLEHELCLLTVMVVQKAVIEETPYGHVIKYDQETE